MSKDVHVFSSGSDKQQSGYDYKRLIKECRDRGKYTDFNIYIKDKMKECAALTDQRLTVKGIAAEMGISYQMLKKIVSMQKHTQKRDIIIAVCACLYLSPDQTNVALELYPSYPLNENSPRDLLIIVGLIEKRGFKGINDILLDCEELPLNVTENTYTDYQKNARELRIGTDDEPKNDNPIIETVAYYLPEVKCFCFEYDPNLYDYMAVMKYIDDAGYTNELRLLDPDLANLTTYDQEGKQISSRLLDKRPDSPFKTDEPIEANLLVKMKQLQFYKDSKAKETLAMLDDTRNYGYRVDIYLENGEFNIYGEIFNHFCPETGEYYQIRIADGNHSITMSRKSLFLREYLESDYTKYYAEDPAPSVWEYASIAKMQESSDADFFLYPESYDGPNPGQSYEWKKCLNELHIAIKETICDIRDRKKPIYFRMMPDMEAILKTFDMTDTFGYEEIHYTDDIVCDHLKTNPAPLPNGMLISYEDLERADELGIGSQNELVGILDRYGSLDRLFEETLKQVSFEL